MTTDYSNIQSKFRTEQLKRRSNESLGGKTNWFSVFMYTFLIGTITGAVLLLPSPEGRYEKHLRKNRCENSTIIATKEDAQRGYRNLAKKIMAPVDVKLQNPVGIEYLEKLVKEKNQNIPIIAGQEYKTLKCEGCN